MDAVYHIYDESIGVTRQADGGKTGQRKLTGAAGSPLEFPCSCIIGQGTQAEPLWRRILVER